MKWGHPRLKPREIPPEAVERGILNLFRYNFRPDVDNDVISSATVEYVSMDGYLKFGDSRSNGSRDFSRG